VAGRKRILARRSVLKQLDLDGEVLDHLEELQIVIPVRRPGRERGYHLADVDRLRVYQVLVRELGVNPAGAEIILRMRNQLLHIRQNMSRLLSEMEAQGMLEEFQKVLQSLEDDFW
jgi:MerR family transcriptional regulator/heat shock protein HspR